MKKAGNRGKSKKQIDDGMNKNLLTYLKEKKDSIVSAVEKLTWDQLKRLQSGERKQ